MSKQWGRLRWLTAIILIAPFLGSAEAPRADRWRWSNPAPHGNNVMDMLITSDIGLQVGDAGSVHVRRSDERWRPAFTDVHTYLRGVTMLDGRIIVVGESGTAVWSDDGIAFQAATLNPPNTLDWFEGVTASAQRAVAVGDAGSIYTSTDGAAWTAADSGTTEWLRGVAFGAGAFVAVGEHGAIARSTDGLAWTTINSGVSEHLNRVRFLGAAGNGSFIAVGNQGVALTSPTGQAPWTSLNSGVTNDLFDVASNNLGTLLVGDEAMLFKSTQGSGWLDQTSLTDTNAAPPGIYLAAHGKGSAWLVAGRSGLLMDGVQTGGMTFNWSATPINSSRAWLWDLTEQNGLRVAVGDLANIQTSLDGILWTQEAVPVARTNTVLLGVGGTTNLLLAVGNDGNVLSSQVGLVDIAVTNEVGPTNITVEGFGVIWSNSASFTTADLQGVDARDGVYILSGEGGAVFSSLDGFAWTARSTPSTSFLSSVAIGSSACVAVGANGTMLRSVDQGATWTAIDSGSADWLYRVRWLEDQFVVVGEGGTILTSPDGLSWMSRSSGVDKWLTDVERSEGYWFVTGYQGTLLTSSNLTDWAVAPLPTGKSLFAASARSGQLLLAGVEGVILRNQVTPATTPVQLLDYNHTLSSDTNGVATVYEVFLFGGEPDQFFELGACADLCGGAWTNVNGVLEMYDSSGALYAIRTRDATNAPASEYYRTRLVP